MTDPFGDLDSARATINLQVEQARERTVAMNVLADTVSSTTATVRSPRGEVAVTATAMATISRIDLTDAAVGLAPAALAGLLTETVARAQRAAAELAVDAAAATLGADNPVVAQLRTDVDTRFAPDDTTLR